MTCPSALFIILKFERAKECMSLRPQIL